MAATELNTLLTPTPLWNSIMFKKNFYGLLTLMLAFSLHLSADSISPADDLVQRLASIERLRGEFTQTLFSENQDILQSSQGVYAVNRTGRYRWDTQSPFKQLLIGDEHKIYLFDEDLEQLTIRALSEQDKQTPLSLLSGDLSKLEDQYVVERNGQDSFVLKPKGNWGANLKQFELKFIGPVLTSLSLLDGLAQKTVIEFKNSELNPHFDNSLFIFKPPEGTDIVDER